MYKVSIYPVAVIVLLLLFSHLLHAEEKFSKLTERNYLYLYSKSENVTNLKFGGEYTIDDVTRAISCGKTIVTPITVSQEKRDGLLVAAKCGKEFKIVILMVGTDYEYDI